MNIKVPDIKQRKKRNQDCYLESKCIICDISGMPSLKDTRHLQAINLSSPQEQDLCSQITARYNSHGKDTQGNVCDLFSLKTVSCLSEEKSTTPLDFTRSLTPSLQ